MRDYRAWYAHITLAMLAAAYLAATRAADRRYERSTRRRKRGSAATSRDGLIPLTSNEIRRLLAALILTPVACLTSAITWSNWRRRRQHQPRTCHYRRRGQHPPL